ncbi:MAG TPA: hypothetical protein VIV12_22400 [Streptosporangiaceae bacterium]
MMCRAQAGSVALERVAAALEPGEFATTLVTGTGRAPRVWVVCRRSGVAEQIHVLDGWYSRP